MTNVSLLAFYAFSPIQILLASSVPCIAHSYLETWCILRRCIQTPWENPVLLHIKHLSPQNSHHYHGISIAIPRYILPCNFHCYFTWLEFHRHFALHDHIEMTWYLWQDHRSSLFTCYARSFHILVHCQRHLFIVIIFSKLCVNKSAL